MKVLVLQHVDCEPPGFYADALLAGGAVLQVIHLGRDDLPDWRGFDAIIAMGGPMGALDDELYQWLGAERELIARAVKQGLPYLGVCLGAQLLAAALGARVYEASLPEVGVGTVELTATGRADELLRHLPSRIQALQWHQDTFDLPGGAQHLATSALCRNQVFRTHNAWGVQFHLEVNTDLAQPWLELPAYRSSAERVLGDGQVDRALDGLREIEDVSRGICASVIDAWLNGSCQVKRDS